MQLIVHNSFKRNVKYLCGKIENFSVPVGNFYSSSIYRETYFATRYTDNLAVFRVAVLVVLSMLQPVSDSSFPVPFSTIFCRFLNTVKYEVVDGSLCPFDFDSWCIFCTICNCLLQQCVYKITRTITIISWSTSRGLCKMVNRAPFRLPYSRST